MWQDLVLTIGFAIFSIGLIPTFSAEVKSPRRTSAVNALVFTVFALAFFTLHFWYASGAALLVAGLWIALLLQSFRRSRLERFWQEQILDRVKPDAGP